LPHGEWPVAEHALNKPNDVFALQWPSPSADSCSRICVDSPVLAHYIVSTGQLKERLATSPARKTRPASTRTTREPSAPTE
jgi:hypothetical protein